MYIQALIYIIYINIYYIYISRRERTSGRLRAQALLILKRNFVHKKYI